MIRTYFQQPKIYATTPRAKGYHGFRAPLLYCFIALLLILAVWFLFFSSFFKVKKITISGSLNPQVQEEINKLYGKNMLVFWPGKIEKELAKREPSISSLQIYKGIPDILKIKVNVRTPKITWISQGKDYFIDQGGVIFSLEEEGLDEENEPLPVVIDSKNAPVEIGSQIVSSDFVDFVIMLVKDFQPQIGTAISEIRLGETTFQAEVATQEGWRVYFDTTRSPNSQINALKKLLERYKDQIKEYVDLRVEGRAYYK